MRVWAGYFSDAVRDLSDPPPWNGQPAPDLNGPDTQGR